MPEGFQHLHPRRLYSRLLASPSLDERAQLAIDFLCGCTGAPRGLLCLAREAGAFAAARVGELGAEVVSEAERTWHRDLDQPDANRTRTIDLAARRKPDSLPPDQLWRSGEGSTFMRYVLGTYRGPRWVPVGVAMLETTEDFSPLRHAYIEAVCNAFINAGNVPGQAAEASSP